MQARERIEAMLARSEKATPGPWFDNSTDELANCVWNTDGFGTTLPHDQEKQICGQGFFESHRPSPEQHDKNMRFIASSRTDLPALAKCLLAAIGPLERCRDKLIELRDSERMLGASAYERALIQYRIDEANEALDIINRELGE